MNSNNREAYVHPSAVVDEGAEIGAGTYIWHFSHVMGGAKIGEACNLGQNVFVAGGVVLGRGVKVQNNVSLYEGVICGDEVFIGPSVVFTNVINPRSFLIRKNEYRTTKIGKGATIGANATLLCGIEIGVFAFVGAGAVVTRNVPAYALFYGNPARHRGWMSEAGYKLEFDGQGRADCPSTGEHYRLADGVVKKISQIDDDITSFN